MALNRDPIAFPTLDEAQIRALGTFATLKTFQMGETLFAAGERDFKFFIVKTGEVAIVDHSSGQDKIVTVHEPREFTGDVDMLTGRAVVVSAIARTPCEVYEISAADLRRILNEMPRVSNVLLRAFLMRRQLLEESGSPASEWWARAMRETRIGFASFWPRTKSPLPGSIWRTTPE